MKKKVTAEEFLAQLNSDPEHRKNRAEAEQMRAKRAADLSRAEAPLIEELQLVGVDVRSAWDLINRSGGQRKVLRILLHHLQRPYPAPVREGIARALAVPAAKFAWDRLKQLYENEREARPKDGLAVALAAIANDERIEDVIRLARDVRNGSSRILLLSALERSRNPQAHKTLTELDSDQDLKKEIPIILRRLKKKATREKSYSGDIENGSSAPLNEAMPDLAETSLNFEAELVEAFLAKLSALIEGFGPVEINKVLRMIDDLEVDDEQKLGFRVTYQGQAMPLNIIVFKDDVEAPDLYFFAQPNLIQGIDNLMIAFNEQNGIQR